jgi:hypothetical protein
MNTPSKISIRLFAGFLLSSEIRMHLHKSPIWKRSSFQDKETFPLLEVHFQHQEYIGIFLKEAFLPLTDVQEVEKSLRYLMTQYCINLSTEKLPIKLFPQIFIT